MIYVFFIYKKSQRDEVVSTDYETDMLYRIILYNFK